MLVGYIVLVHVLCFIVYAIEFAESDVSVNITVSPSTPTAGDQFNITCTATLPERLIHAPNVIIVSLTNGGNEIQAEMISSILTLNTNTYSRTYTIDPVSTSDARQYFCRVGFEALFSSILPRFDKNL